MSVKIERRTTFNTFGGIIFILGLCIAPQLKAQNQKVACVGNSITYGYGLSNPSSQSYPGQMQVLLGTTDWQVGNFGDSSRLLQKLGYSYWDSWQYGQALAFNPNAVVIGLGTNDAYPWALDGRNTNFKTDYKALIQSFQNLSTKPEVSICLIAPAENSGWGLHNSYIDKVNVNIKEVALEMGVGLIDLHSAMEGHWPDLFQPDSVHPDVEGAAEIARTVKEMLVATKPDIRFENGQVIAPDGDGYQWYIDGEPVDSKDRGNLKEMNAVKTGTYKVSVKLNADTETRVISSSLDINITGISSFRSRERGIVVYPNPVTDIIYLGKGSYQEGSHYMIYDLSGKPVISGQVSEVAGSINVSSLSMGVYLLAIASECIKLVKSR